jgi:tryptophanase
MKKMNELGVPVPVHKSHVVRPVKKVTVEQRKRALRENEYNMFSFPADLLVLDYLSDSGTTAMTDAQWAALFHGDESYGRNKGYYTLLDTIRDTFERGDDRKHSIELILSGTRDVERLMNELYLVEHEGGFVNGGTSQLKRPNAFLTPQGRAAEHLLCAALREVLDELNEPGLDYWVPNNGHFDTTGANIRAVGFEPVNLFGADVLEEFPAEKMDEQNPFKGDMDTDRLEALLSEKGRDRVPLIYLTITNNTVAGQPVSMANIKEVHRIADEWSVPLFFDACRFAENAAFIKQFERGYQDRSIESIVQEMFSHADGFTISFKKDGMANMGGGLFFRDRGAFANRFSTPDCDMGVRLKEKQILWYGNDSYGGLSGRDIMALSSGLSLIVAEGYLFHRVGQTRRLAYKLAKAGVPVVLPAGGHAVYLDMDRLLEGTGIETGDFGGVGFTIELLIHYGIRACELGPFAFEWDKLTEEQRESTLNLVRLAIPRNAYSEEHIDYTVAAVAELHRNKDRIPKVEVVRGKKLRLRHFQSGLEPIYPK